MKTLAITGEGIHHFVCDEITNDEMNTILEYSHNIEECIESFKTEKKKYLSVDDYKMLYTILTVIAGDAIYKKKNKFNEMLKKYFPED